MTEKNRHAQCIFVR